MKKILALFLVCFFLSPSLALAGESLPMSFYGQAELNGNTLPAGSVIQVFAAGVLVGKSAVNENGYYNEDDYAKSRLIVSSYKGNELVFKYISRVGDETYKGNTVVKYLGIFEAGKNVQFDLPFVYNASLSFAPYVSSTTLSELATSTLPEIGSQTQVLGAKIIDYSAFNSLFGLDSELTNAISQNEAEIINGQSNLAKLSRENNDIYNKIAATHSFKINDSNKKAIAYFIQYGSPTTKRLGAGERAGALSSFMSALGKAPNSIFDWQDVIKISNGRWPLQKNQIVKDEAIFKFKEIYLRMPDLENSNDNAAVMIITCGLRPSARNQESEKAAIKSFRAIYKKNPASAEDWDAVRAIAYSGAKR